MKKKKSRNLRRLEEYFKKMKKVSIAFSGGIDSTALAIAAAGSLGPEKVKLIHLTTPIHSPADVVSAESTAIKLGLGITFVKLNPLNNKRFTANPNNRCYYCKKDVFKLIKKRSRGFAVVEGTNASDMTDFRPGFKAVRDMRIKSPLYELDMTKTDARAIVKEGGFKFYKALPNTCFATRIAYGVQITNERVRRIEKAENFIKKLIKTDFIRVRDHGDYARIELKKKDIKTAAKKHDLISEKLHKLGYKFVALDMDGYRQGSLNP